MDQSAIFRSDMSEPDKSMFGNKYVKWLLAGAMLGATMILSNTSRSLFIPIFLCFAFLFTSFILIIRSKKVEQQLTFWLTVGVLLRISTIAFFPNLSDDIYRFIWDGELLRQGINPFNATPTYYLENVVSGVRIDYDLYQHLNSADYYTVYPPIAQMFFLLGSYLFSGHWMMQSIFLKFVILFFEVGTIYYIYKILVHFKMPKHRVLFYALNPLVIIELCGNIHFEGVMIFFFILSFWLLTKQRYFLAGLAFGFSFLAKMVTAIASPFLIRRIHWRSLLYVIGGGLIVTVLGFLPLVNAQFGSNFGDSLNLYFQKFEFNASLYYVFRWMGYQWKGFNMIAQFGPYLAVAGFIIILIAVIKEKAYDLKTYPKMALFALTIYFFFSTTIHPWYITTLVALCCFTSFRFPILWSFLIFGTYMNYMQDQYEEILWIVIIEYSALIAFITWELWRIKKAL